MQRAFLDRLFRRIRADYNDQPFTYEVELTDSETRYDIFLASEYGSESDIEWVTILFRYLDSPTNNARLLIRHRHCVGVMLTVKSVEGP
jgi:hypothetical protein